MSQLNAKAGSAVNACQWFNYFSFDIMGDMAFGQPFDMVASGKQVCEEQLVAANTFLTHGSIR
jgi:hypothetical protein